MTHRCRQDRSLRRGQGAVPGFASPYCNVGILRSAAPFSTMPAVAEKRGGGLRNTIYEQQTRSGRRLTRARLFLYKIVVPVGLSLLRLVWGWSRVVRVIGAEHMAAAPGQAP